MSVGITGNFLIFIYTGAWSKGYRCMNWKVQFYTWTVIIAAIATVLKTRVVEIHFLSRQYGSNLNHCDVIGPELC